MLVCPECFGDQGLRRRVVEMRAKAPNEKCDMHPRRKGVPVEQVAAVLDAVIRNHYAHGSYDSVHDDFRGEGLEQLVYELTSADEERVARALVEQLIEDDDYWPGDGEDAFYSEDVGYVRDEHALAGHSRLWGRFRESLVHEQRFFNAAAYERVATIFDGVHLQRNASRQGPVYLINPGDLQSTFWRARIANDDATRDAITEDLVGELGPPPARRRRAGRLNPSGVSAFYGAFDFDTCIAELRPTVGSIVIGARFAITEPVLVLDTTRFAAPPKQINLFARDALNRAAQWRFMRRFMEEIAQPVSPHDEHLDYIPTQAVAEYLAHNTFTFAGQSRVIEAIIYGSAQNPGGRNIALLRQAAVVGDPAPQPGPEPPPAPDTGLGFPFDDWSSGPRSGRIVPLPDSLEKRAVSGARYTSVRYYDAGDPLAGEHDDFDWQDGALDE